MAKLVNDLGEEIELDERFDLEIIKQLLSEQNNGGIDEYLESVFVQEGASAQGEKSRVGLEEQMVMAEPTSEGTIMAEEGVVVEGGEVEVPTEIEPELTFGESFKKARAELGANQVFEFKKGDKVELFHTNLKGEDFKPSEEVSTRIKEHYTSTPKVKADEDPNIIITEDNMQSSEEQSEENVAVNEEAKINIEEATTETGQTEVKNYEGKTFGEAFKQARAELGKDKFFKWNNETYGTAMGNEKFNPSNEDIKAAGFKVDSYRKVVDERFEKRQNKGNAQTEAVTELVNESTKAKSNTGSISTFDYTKIPIDKNPTTIDKGTLVAKNGSTLGNATIKVDGKVYSLGIVSYNKQDGSGTWDNELSSPEIKEFRRYSDTVNWDDNYQLDEHTKKAFTEYIRDPEGFKKRRRKEEAYEILRRLKNNRKVVNEHIFEGKKGIEKIKEVINSLERYNISAFSEKELEQIAKFVVRTKNGFTYDSYDPDKSLEENLKILDDTSKRLQNLSDEEIEKLGQEWKEKYNKAPFNVKGWRNNPYAVEIERRTTINSESERRVGFLKEKGTLFQPILTPPEKTEVNKNKGKSF